MAHTYADAYEALDAWKADLPIVGFSVPARTADDGFIAGYDAGTEAIRAAVLKLWDENDAWIPGADYRRLAAALGVPPERTLTYRNHGESKPSQSMRSRNIPFE